MRKWTRLGAWPSAWVGVDCVAGIMRAGEVTMVSLTAEPAASTSSPIVLHDVSWELYESLLREIGDQHVLVTYDNGSMEIMSPLPEHEIWKGIIGRMIEALTEELNIPIASLGSTTFRRRDLAKGLEPDECYYIQHEAQVRNKKRLNLRSDPPPDLVIEIDISHRDLDRESIYAAMGVPRSLALRRPEPAGAAADGGGAIRGN